MKNWHKGSEVAKGAGREAVTEGSAAEAERLFAKISAEPAQRRNGARSSQTGTELAASPETSAIEPRSAGDAELRSLATAALAAADRIAEMVGVLSAQLDTTSADVADLGRALEEALFATKSRLDVIERAVLYPSRRVSDLPEDMGRLRARLNWASELARTDGPEAETSG